MVPGKKTGSMKISLLSVKISGGEKGIKVIGLKLGIELKRLKTILREL
jgi:hypothetical protein